MGHAIYEVARKDVLQHIRTKRLLVIGLFFFLVLQLVTLVIPLGFDLVRNAPEAGESSHENSWFFVHLNASLFGGLFAIQLLTIVLTADAVCSEWGNRTIFLLLSKPVSRTSFVLGKYLGALASTVPMVLAIYVLQYLLMMAIFPGQPTGDEVVGFTQMLGMLVLGTMAISAVALFFSTLLRSNVMALVLSLLSALILFPILSAIGDIHYGIDSDRMARENSDPNQPPPEPDVDEWQYDWSHYITPAAALASAPALLLPGGEDDGFALGSIIPQAAPQRTWLGAVSALGFTTLLVGLSILRVQRRDFE